MSQDRQKLIQILHNLERDYEDGLISKEKYVYLSNQYKHKIETIDVSNRIRAMQGKKESDDARYKNERNKARKNREEDEQLVRKFIQNPESYTHSKPRKQEEESSSGWYTILAVVFLLVAFGVGISFGISTLGLDGGVSDLLGSSATINDTAFPQVVANKSVDSNYTHTTSSDYTKSSSSSSSSDSSYSGSSSSSTSTDSGSSSSDSGSSSSDSSSGGSSSGSGGSSSGE